MRNFEYITSSPEELAGFINQVAYARNTPWSDEFSDTFCKSCPTTHVVYSSLKEDDLHECDFKDGICPNGDDIIWWLEQERISE